jgi:hypothetical protein
VEEALNPRPTTIVAFSAFARSVADMHIAQVDALGTEGEGCRRSHHRALKSSGLLWKYFLLQSGNVYVVALATPRAPGTELHAHICWAHVLLVQELDIQRILSCVRLDSLEARTRQAQHVHTISHT